MAEPPTSDFERLIARIGRALDDAEVPYMVIGGQAVLLHGEPRLTQDIDITLGLDPDALPDVLDVCGTAGLEPLPEDPADFVRETFVLPAVERETGLRADFIFSTTSYEREAIRRAVSVEVAGTSVDFATAEDLILHKLFAGRPRDLEDARGVVRRRGSGIDWSYVERWAGEFASVPGRENLPTRVRELREEGG